MSDLGLNGFVRDKDWSGGVAKTSESIMQLKKEAVTEELRAKLDSVHQEVGLVTKLLSKNSKGVDLSTPLGCMDALDKKLEGISRVYVLVSMCVYIRFELDQIFRENPQKLLSQEYKRADELLNITVQTYKSIQYNLGAELQGIKELMYVRFPELREKRWQD